MNQPKNICENNPSINQAIRWSTNKLGNQPTKEEIDEPTKQESNQQSRMSTTYWLPQRTNQGRGRSPILKSRMAFDDLPDDCILLIFRFIPVEQLITLERISSRWYSLSQYTKVIVSKNKISWKARQSLHVWSVLERAWQRYGDLNFEPQCLLRDCLSRCGDYLTVLSFAECPPFRMSRFTIEMIGERCPNLESLDLSNRILADSSVQGLITMPKLRSLSLVKCFESGNLAYEARKNIDRSLSEVLPKLVHLNNLNMRGNRGIGTQGGKLWFGSLKVHSLNVVGTGLAPQQFQIFVAENTRCLKEFRASELTFTYSLNSSGRDVQMSQLSRNLIQTWRDQLTCLELCEFTLCFEQEFKPAIRLLPSLTGLTELRLQNNKLVNDDLLSQICLGCSKLRTLSVSSCPVSVRGLEFIRNLDFLSNLDISKLKCVTDHLLAILSMKMTLETVILMDCGSRVTRDGLLSLLLNCPCLSKLDVRGCKKVTRQVIDEFSKCQSLEFLYTASPPAHGPSTSNINAAE
uniref:F-box domain-containing protein n=1 Tax=Romanomermis culicivorax TaxID=13658 RepID=A0A915IG52_ROMCU